MTTKTRRMACGIATVTCYKLVCPVCGVDWDDGVRVPYFNTRDEAAEYLEQLGIGRDGNEPLGRTLARACRIVGCGEAAYDKLHTTRER